MLMRMPAQKGCDRHARRNTCSSVRSLINLHGNCNGTKALQCTGMKLNAIS